MAKSQTDPRVAYVYVAHEVEEEGFPTATNWCKVGVMAESCHADPYHQRRRALQQGNIRKLDFSYTHRFEKDLGEGYQPKTDSPAKREALELEARVHSALRKEGYVSRHDTTKQTGHGEWFNCTPAKAIEVMIREAAKPAPVATTWITKKDQTYSFVSSGLFEGL
jgi:hypothetical protein